MANKLVQRYNHISQEIKRIQVLATTGQADASAFKHRLAQLQAEQADLKNVLHLMAISHIRDEAWRALAH